jgi:hypothetical protein
MSKNNYAPVPKDNILRSIESVLKNKDIDKLTKEAYNFLYLMSGFIAHYDLYGFRSNYRDLRYLVDDILHSADCIDPERMIQDKWFAEQYGEIYCKSKVETFKGIANLANQYFNEVEMVYTMQQSSQELEQARIYAEKNGYKIVKQ